MEISKSKSGESYVKVYICIVPDSNYISTWFLKKKVVQVVIKNAEDSNW